MAAAQEGKLTTRQQVASHVRRILDDPQTAKPYLLQFFREYFEYHRAPDVFKDKPKEFTTDPKVLVSDTDHLIEHVLTTDKDVFRELLTTPRTFVNLRLQKNKRTGQVDQIPAQVLNSRKDKGQKKPLGLEYLYGFEVFPSPQPVEVPGGVRLGILMRPSWLVAWSTNFNNDPVRRGRWVRERLLGGTVPDLLIGVAAQVPDEPEHTFRHRLRVTRQGRCWTCHQKMDDLGLPFEQFDHYGRFRTVEAVLDPEATAHHIDTKTKKLPGPVYRDEKLDTSGHIADSGDPALDGAIKEPREFVRKLANSERCRQVFVRHTFRYFLGRNETLPDSRTLQAADRAYVENGGSFKALVVSLLTSDSFLYRSASTQGDHR